VTDFTYGQARPNWLVNTGIESTTSNMDFITISTQVSILPYASAIALGQTTTQATASQTNLNKLIEIVSLRGQPVIMGNVTTANSGATFNLFLATEHNGGWSLMGSGTTVSAAGTNSLLGRLVADGINFGFGANTTSITTTTSAAVSASTTIPVASTTGILVGMNFTGTGVSGGVVAEILSSTSFSATVAQTISSSVTLTFTPVEGGVNDTPSTGTNGGLAVTFSSVLT